MGISAGQLTEQITILTNTPLAKSVSSITRSSQTATVTTAAAHGFSTGDYVLHAGATQTEYNVEALITVTGATTYTYTVSGSPASPATGTITATYVSNSSGGSAAPFYTLASGLWACIEPMSASEQLAAGGISAVGSFNVTLYYRADITPAMRLTWRRYQESAARTYEIHSVQPNKDEPRSKLDLEIGIVEG
jgi:head-tail adaptor